MNKYPRTFHLPWSPGISNDDKVMKSISPFEGEEVIVSLKMDGENTTMHHRGCFARSIASSSHPSRSWVKRMQAEVAHLIPEGYRICGENLFAKHSILYKNLPSYFMGFSVWDEDMCLDWNSTVRWLESLLGFSTVPILYRGIWDEKVIKNIDTTNEYGDPEGYVVRVTRSFGDTEFQGLVGKFVRKGHVTTDDHWLYQPLIQNELERT